MAHAAALGGCALGCDRLSTTHYLAEAIAATGKASAAQVRGILLSYVLEYRAVKNGLKVDTLLSLVNGNDRLARTPKHQRSPSAFYALRSLIDQLFETTDGKIGRTLQDIGLLRAELKTMAASAQAKGAEEDPGVLETILSHAWEGRPIDRTT